MSGKYEWFTGKDGKFYFNLIAGNGQVILTSQGYAGKSGMDNGIASVQTNGVMEERFEKATSDSGKFSFVLKAANSQVIGRSQMYEGESGRDNGIKSVMNNAPTDKIVERAE